MRPLDHKETTQVKRSGGSGSIRSLISGGFSIQQQIIGVRKALLVEAGFSTYNYIVPSICFRYGHNLEFYYKEWCDCKSDEPFFYWLDVVEGRNVDLEECPRSKLKKQFVTYLGPETEIVPDAEDKLRDAMGTVECQNNMRSSVDL